MENLKPTHPTDKAYLSLYKLVPVVIRERSEKKENEKGGFLTSRPSTSRAFMVCVSGTVILWCLSCSLKDSKPD